MEKRPEVDPARSILEVRAGDLTKSFFSSS
jgi:hypothetical protein